jgi:hypothetical protein
LPNTVRTTIDRASLCASIEPHVYSGDRDRSFRLNVTAAHEMVVRD